MAAAKVCHWIASDGRGKFEEASIQRKQKTVMKIIAKGITSFWRSAEALQTADTAKMMQAHNSTMLEETQPSGTKAEKEQVKRLAYPSLMVKLVWHNLFSWDMLHFCSFHRIYSIV